MTTQPSGRPLIGMSVRFLPNLLAPTGDWTGEKLISASPQIVRKNFNTTDFSH